jgi:hypothetical protein
VSGAYDRLWLGLQQARTDDAHDLPSPWTTWTLIGLVRHRQRQRWVGQVVTERLGGGLGQLAQAGALAHPRGRPQKGLVPGLEEWGYYFHGIGCCLTHRLSGERIDVDFYGDHAEGFDVYFYVEYLRSLRRPPAPEHRLMELHPSLETVELGLDELLREGRLIMDPDGDAPRLSAAVLEHEQDVVAFCEAWSAAEPPHRAWLAAQIGDWLAAGAGERAALARRQRIERLLGEFEGGNAALVLLGLHELDAAELPSLLERVLAGAPCAAMSRALQIIEERADADGWCPALFALAARLDPTDPVPSPYLWKRCVQSLLRRGHRVAEVLEALPRAGPRTSGDAALLALEHAPALALPLFREALRSSVPDTRCTAAAVLALLDEPWSRAELRAVLDESHEPKLTRECRAALASSVDPRARLAAREWEARHPRDNDPWASFLPAPAWLVHRMDALRERVLALAGREPPRS